MTEPTDLTEWERRFVQQPDAPPGPPEVFCRYCGKRPGRPTHKGTRANFCQCVQPAASEPPSAGPSPERASPPINADDSRGHKSTSPCEKCGAMEVYVTQDSDDDADFTIHCYACGMHYRVDGPDA